MAFLPGEDKGKAESAMGSAFFSYVICPQTCQSKGIAIYGKRSRLAHGNLIPMRFQNLT